MLEGLLEEIGERYVNTIIDEADLGFSSIYCSYISSVGYRGNILLIDGGNTFNPYIVTRCCRLLSVDEHDVLNRIQISRAFTYHQLSSILKRLEETVRRMKSKIVIITNPTYLYLERSSEEKVFGGFVEVFRDLMATTYRFRLTTLIVERPCRFRVLHGDAFGKKRKVLRSIMEKVIMEVSDSVYTLEKRGNRVVAMRVKHPFFQRGMAVSIPMEPRLLTLDEALGLT